VCWGLLLVVSLLLICPCAGAAAVCCWQSLRGPGLATASSPPSTSGMLHSRGRNMLLRRAGDPTTYAAGIVAWHCWAYACRAAGDGVHTGIATKQSMLPACCQEGQGWPECTVRSSIVKTRHRYWRKIELNWGACRQSEFVVG
jgi:hypothetical protein